MEETLHNFVAFVLRVTKFPVLCMNPTLDKGNLNHNESQTNGKEA